MNLNDEHKEAESDDSDQVSIEDSGDQLENSSLDENFPGLPGEDDEEDDTSFIPVKFSEFPVISDALGSGVITSAVCFIILVFAQIDNPGPMTISMGTGMVYVIVSFFLGVVGWPIFNALFDLKREFLHGKKKSRHSLSKRKKEKKSAGGKSRS